jgi:double-stranded uracil-DNA glycosylase
MKYSFPPVIGVSARILILGSMPGDKSLQASRYYAHPHNAFWPIMGSLLGFDPDLDYAMRLAALQDAGIALWDVLESCRRAGSLDSSIEAKSIIANDFSKLFQNYPGIHSICLNGKSVEQLFRRHVLRSQTLPGHLQLYTLPSTSSANARLRFNDKLTAWESVLAERLRATRTTAVHRDAGNDAN